MFEDVVLPDTSHIGQLIPDAANLFNGGFLTEHLCSYMNPGFPPIEEGTESQCPKGKMHVLSFGAGVTPLVRAAGIVTSKMCAASFLKMATSNSVNANYIGLHTLVASVFSQNEELAELLQRAVYWGTTMFTGGKLPLVLGQDSLAGREARWKLVASRLGQPPYRPACCVPWQEDSTFSAPELQSSRAPFTTNCCSLKSGNLKTTQVSAVCSRPLGPGHPVVEKGMPDCGELRRATETLYKIKPAESKK